MSNEWYEWSRGITFLSFDGDARILFSVLHMFSIIKHATYLIGQHAQESVACKPSSFRLARMMRLLSQTILARLCGVSHAYFIFLLVLF